MAGQSTNADPPADGVELLLPFAAPAILPNYRRHTFLGDANGRQASGDHVTKAATLLAFVINNTAAGRREPAGARRFARITPQCLYVHGVSDTITDATPKLQDVDQPLTM